MKGLITIMRLPGRALPSLNGTPMHHRCFQLSPKAREALEFPSHQYLHAAAQPGCQKGAETQTSSKLGSRTLISIYILSHGEQSRRRWKRGTSSSELLS